MYKAHVEHLFGRLRSFALNNIWQGDATSLAKRLRILLHFVNFDLKRGFTYRPLGPWDYFPVLSIVKVMAMLINKLGEELAKHIWMFASAPERSGSRTWRWHLVSSEKWRMPHRCTHFVPSEQALSIRFLY